MRSIPRWNRMAPALIAAIIGLWAVPGGGVAQAPQGLGQEVAELLPQEVAGFTLQDVQPQDEGAAQAVYAADDGGEPMNAIIAYGQAAAGLHQQVQSQVGEDSGELEVDGKTFTSLQMGSDLIVFKHLDPIFLAAGYEVADPDADMGALESSAVAFLEGLDPAGLAEWTPSEEVAGGAESEAGDDGIERCQDPDCFSEHISRCESAEFGASLAPTLTVVYAVEGPGDGDGCQISFRFEDNPNPDLVDTPLYFTLDPDVGFTQELIQEVMEGCLDGDEAAVERFQCEGPLLEAM